MGVFPFSSGNILRGSDPTGNRFSVAHGCSSSLPSVATRAGRPDPPPDRIRRRRPRLSSLLPRPPTSAVSPPSLPFTLGRSVRPLVRTPILFCTLRALFVLLMFWMFPDSIFSSAAQQLNRRHMASTGPSPPCSNHSVR